VLYITSGIWFVRIIGSAPFFVALVCGQLGGSATLDATGFLGAHVHPMSTPKLAGIVVVVVAAALIQFAIPWPHLYQAWRATCGRCAPTRWCPGRACCCRRGGSHKYALGGGEPGGSPFVDARAFVTSP